MKVLITGATSFIGVPLCKGLLKAGHQVVAIVRKGSGVKLREKVDGEGLSCVELGMEEYELLSESINGGVDAVFALAWNGTRGQDRDDYIMQQWNYDRNIVLLHEAQKMGCKKFITAGSQAEYGPWRLERKETELDPSHPNTEYGKFKLAFYEEAKRFCTEHTMTLVEPRFFSIYGPGDYEKTLVISMLKNMLTNQPCDMTECIQTWDFIYIDDVINGLVLLLESDKAEGIYNFGSGYAAPLKEYVEKMYALTESKSQLNYGAVPYPATGMVNTNPCVEKLESLGWKAQMDFEAGVKYILNSL